MLNWRNFLKAVAAATVSMAAQPPSVMGAQSRGNDMSITVRAGTLGAGLEVSKLVASRISLRAGGNFMQAYFNQTLGDVNYASKLNFLNFTGLADLYIRKRGSFHITGGIVQRSDKVRAIASPDLDGLYRLDEGEYTQAEVGMMTATIDFPAFAPYLGLGFGSPKTQGWRLRPVLDLGVIVGAPKFLLAAEKGSSNQKLMTDLRLQQQHTQEDIDGYAPLWPVVSLGISYHF